HKVTRPLGRHQARGTNDAYRLPGGPPMHQISPYAIRLGLAVPAAAVVLAGCATESSTTYATPNATPSTTSTTYGTSGTSVVNYPTGTYKLYALTTGQRYWVWIPNGVTIQTPPPPPAVPAQTALVVQQPMTVVQQPATTAVVVPVAPVQQPATTAVVVPAAPAQQPTTTAVVVPATPARTVVAGTGQYTLYGDGTSTPYYWVAVPSGVTPP